MNWSAGILVLIGAIIVVIGFSGSQNIVCQAIFGGKCEWLPSVESLKEKGIGKVPIKDSSFINSWVHM